MPNLFLNGLQPEERGRIIKVTGEGTIRRRLLDMGMIRGKEVEMEKRIVPLYLAPPGQRLKIAYFEAGRGLRTHLIGMGLDEGSEIEVVQRGGSGPFLIAIKETRLAIGAGMARKIMVFEE